MKKKSSRSNNPEGRPSEYESERQKILVSLPKDYIEWIDSIAELHCTSRARLINEHLILVKRLTELAFFEINENGTAFHSVPKMNRGKKKNNENVNKGLQITATRDRLTKELFE